MWELSSPQVCVLYRYHPLELICGSGHWIVHRSQLPVHSDMVELCIFRNVRALFQVIQEMRIAVNEEAILAAF